MSLPVKLPAGYVSIYGAGSAESLNSITPPTANFLFGIIDQTWGAMPNFAAVGDSVLFKSEDATRLSYNSWIYSIIAEDKILFIENIPV